MIEALVVTPAEAGQKLLQFLARRFDAPQSVLHRWIRSGQVRINGGRAKPFDRVALGNEIRVPPFAVRGKDAAGTANAANAAGVAAQTSAQGGQGVPLPSLVAETAELLLFCKPAGLAVHPGTGHSDSLTTRLAAHYHGADFMPTPVHRLDRDTSGLLLVAKTYAALRRLTEAFARHDGTVRKDYLLWVRGDCPWSTPVRLQDRLVKQTDTTGYEKMVSTRPARTGQAGQTDQMGQANQADLAQKKTEDGKDASLTALCLRHNRDRSLLLVRLHTGRTHQIRVQLAARGFPLIGDVKYGGPHCESGLKLHAARLTLDRVSYTALPLWQGAWSVTDFPALLEENGVPVAGVPVQTYPATGR